MTNGDAGRRLLIAGNWKMNGLMSDALALAGGIRAQADAAGTMAADLLVCPPATLIVPVAECLQGSAVAVGGQDCHAEASGAFTGSVSATMLADAGAAYVILGHSERRHGLGEDDATVQAKMRAALAAGLVAIVCIGETEAERDAGATNDVLSRQIAGSVAADIATAANTVIAYEPVWAIGTGRTATPEQVAEAHAHVRQEVVALLGADTAAAMRLLYGGSMKPANAAELLALADVDGGLIGGASLKAEDFLAIATAAP